MLEIYPQEIVFIKELIGFPLIVLPKSVIYKTNILVGSLVGLLCKKEDEIKNLLFFKVAYFYNNKYEEKFMLGEEYASVIKETEKIIIKSLEDISSKYIHKNKIVLLIENDLPIKDKEFLINMKFLNKNVFYITPSGKSMVLLSEKDPNIEGIEVLIKEEIFFKERRNVKENWRQYIDLIKQIRKLKKEIEKNKKVYIENLDLTIQKIENNMFYISQSISKLKNFKVILNLIKNSIKSLNQNKFNQTIINNTTGKLIALDEKDFEKYKQKIEDYKQKKIKLFQFNRINVDFNTNILEERVKILREMVDLLNEKKEEFEKLSKSFHEIEDIEKEIKNEKDECIELFEKYKKEWDEILEEMKNILNSPWGEKFKELWKEIEDKVKFIYNYNQEQEIFEELQENIKEFFCKLKEEKQRIIKKQRQIGPAL